VTFQIKVGREVLRLPILIALVTALSCDRHQLGCQWFPSSSAQRLFDCKAVICHQMPASNSGCKHLYLDGARASA
jgi:hypothetical protein